MNFLTELIKGFLEKDGFGRIERLCGEIGWAIDERGEDRIFLHFKDPFAGIRKVFIAAGDELVLFAVYSFAVLPAERVPHEVNGYLVLRNGQMKVGAWQAKEDDDGDVLFCVQFTTSLAGLSAGMFKLACESMICEAQAFDERMIRAGLLSTE